MGGRWIVVGRIGLRDRPHAVITGVGYGGVLLGAPSLIGMGGVVDMACGVNHLLEGQ